MFSTWVSWRTFCHISWWACLVARYLVNCPTRQSLLLLIGSLHWLIDWFPLPDNKEIEYSWQLCATRYHDITFCCHILWSSCLPGTTPPAPPASWERSTGTCSWDLFSPLSHQLRCVTTIKIIITTLIIPRSSWSSVGVPGTLREGLGWSWRSISTMRCYTAREAIGDNCDCDEPFKKMPVVNQIKSLVWSGNVSSSKSQTGVSLERARDLEEVEIGGTG